MIYIFWNDGHAGLAVTGLGKERNFYISVFSPTMEGDRRLRLHKLSTDLNNGLYPYRNVIAIPSEESCGSGLSELAMFNWWRSIDADKFDFSSLNNNCRTTVLKALKAGLRGSSLSSLREFDLSVTASVLPILELLKIKEISTAEDYELLLRRFELVESYLNHLYKAELDIVAGLDLILCQLKEIAKATKALDELKRVSEQVLGQVNMVIEKLSSHLSDEGSVKHETREGESSIEKAERELKSLLAAKPCFIKQREGEIESVRQPVASLAICGLFRGDVLKDKLKKGSTCADQVAELVDSTKNPHKGYFHCRATAAGRMVMM